MNTEVLIPYNLREDELVLDPAVLNHKDTDSIQAVLEWLFATGMRDEELERIMRGTICLFAAKAGTFRQCLDTAVIWERG
jgi:hypothetical protein